MGLGKTVQAVGISNLDPSCRRVLVVCPASLKKNWRREWIKWCAKGLSVAIAEGSKAWPTDDVVIVNYDVLHKFRSQIDAIDWDLLVADECHLVKNPKSRRTAALLGRKSRKPDERVDPLQARRVVFLTGTPILNRPVEMFPLLERIDPNGLGDNFMAFAKRYCAAEQNRFGWDFSGASNLQELQVRLRGSVMVRRLKEEVLKELPPKRRQLIRLDSSETKGLKAAVAALENQSKDSADRLTKLVADAEMAKALGMNAYRAAAAKLGAARKVAFEEMARARHDLAVAKAPVVAQRVAELLDENEGMKIVVMAHHADVVDQLRGALGKYGVAEVTGRTAVGSRQAECDRFQIDKSCRAFIGTIKAAGVGLTLTAAHIVAFVELDWVPGNVSQAEDRCHRIGQKDSVLVWHFVVEDSLDSRMVELLVSKQVVADEALNNLDPSTVGADDVSIDEFEVVSDAEIAAEEAPFTADADALEQGATEGRARMDSERRSQRANRNVAQRAATSGIEPGTLEAEGRAMSQEARELSYRCMIQLSNSDGDFATKINDVGFSKADVLLGHALANIAEVAVGEAHLGMMRRLVMRYRRQLPERTVEIVTGRHQ
jgi:hypothetical protein